jgi:hypothetical protein
VASEPAALGPGRAGATVARARPEPSAVSSSRFHHRGRRGRGEKGVARGEGAIQVGGKARPKQHSPRRARRGAKSFFPLNILPSMLGVPVARAQNTLRGNVINLEEAVGSQAQDASAMPNRMIRKPDQASTHSLRAPSRPSRWNLPLDLPPT